MIPEKLLETIHNLKSEIITANRLYDLLIVYSDDKTLVPNDRKIIKLDSIKSAKYNIKQLKLYLKEINIINKKLMKNFNSLDKKKNVYEPPPPYKLFDDEIDYLLDYCNEDLTPSELNMINNIDISNLDILNIKI